MRIRFLTALMLVATAMGAVGPASQVSGASLTLDMTLAEASVYQGDVANLSLTVTNTGVNDIVVHKIGIHPDWMPRLFFHWVDLPDAPVLLSQGGSLSASLGLEIPLDLSPGPYYCYAKVQFKEREPSGRLGPLQAWTNGNVTIEVHDASERLYDQLVPVVLERISYAKGQRLELSEAVTLLARAESEYGQAVESAGAADYPGAVAHLEASSALLEQAIQTEENYWRQETLNLTSRVESKLPSLEQAESPNARRFLSLAQAALSEARGLAEERKYRVAISRAEEAELLVNQALLLEDEYQKSKTELYIILGAIAVAGASVAFVGALIIWRRPRARREASQKSLGPAGYQAQSRSR